MIVCTRARKHKRVRQPACHQRGRGVRTGENSTINNLVRFDGCRKDDAERTLVVEYGLVAAMLRSWQGVSNVQQTTPV